LCIALEVLVANCLKEGQKDSRVPQEQIYLYISDLIAYSPNERKLVYDAVRACFHLRNKIVHRGDQAPPEKEILQQGMKVLKESLFQIITNSPTAQKKSLPELLFGTPHK
jgi:hypothetical protein